MAYYRCGGGGLPAGLQTNMDAVLNKKFGTSTTYPPADWPDTVNLMGPLPEKTVSGAIAVIEDGADDVPTKSLIVTIPATLSGVSEVSETQTGRNLASELLEWNATNRIISPVFLKSGTYTVSFQRSVTPSAIYIRKGETVYLSGDAYATKYNSTSFTFTADESTYYYVQIYRSASSTSWEDAPITDVQLEIGSTANAYEPYIAPTTYTASLGRTIYGGEVDIVNGVGQAQFAYHKLTSDDTIYMYNSANGFLVNTSSFAEGEMVALSNSGGLCNAFDTVTTSTNTGVCFGMSNNSNIYFIQVQSIMGSTLQDIKDYIDNHDIYVVYRLATPTDFTFTGQEIPTRLGYNAFWSDDGDTEVTYRRDIDLALGGN